MSDSDGKAKSNSVPLLRNCGRYLAEDNTGQWHYLNHARQWQTCPPPFIKEQPREPA